MPKQRISGKELTTPSEHIANDIIFGYRNDYAWQRYILDKLSNDLEIISGDIFWQVQNLHIYEKHFHLIK